MSKIKCNKCGCDIKIKTLFLEKAGCENCGNSIDFSSMDQLSGLRQGLLFASAVVFGVVLLFVMLRTGISFGELSSLFIEMSAGAAVLLLLGACVFVLIIGTIEKIIGCSIYEQWRKNEERLERLAELKRREDASDEEKQEENSVELSEKDQAQLRKFVGKAKQ